jgi:hypothetical protein
MLLTGSKRKHSIPDKAYRTFLGPTSAHPMIPLRCPALGSLRRRDVQSMRRTPGVSENDSSPEPGPAGRIRSRIVHSHSKRAVGAAADSVNLIRPPCDAPIWPPLVNQGPNSPAGAKSCGARLGDAVRT